jgi:hypothetical protein
LGNVHLTFTTKYEQDVGTGTYESANSASEQSKLLNYDKARKINSVLSDHTYDGVTPPVTGTHAQRLNGSEKEKVGLARSLSVMPGYKLNVEVFAKFPW